MVMVQDVENGKILVQERVKYWCGVTFPGGHVEDGESIYDSAVREIKEETGLEVKNLKSCGFVHWFNNKSGDRYFTFFYKTTDFAGQLLESTEEGKVFWTTLDELMKMKLPNNFKEYLPMFIEGEYNEAFCSWNEDIVYDFTKPNPQGIVYKK